MYWTGSRRCRWLPLFMIVVALGCSRQPMPPAATTSTGTTPPTTGSQNGPASGQLRYVQLDIGQGDAELIVSPDGHAMLVDGGPPGEADTILGALRDHGVTRLDLAVASHPHNDHIGSLDEVVHQVPVDQFLDSGYAHGSQPQRRLLEAIKARKVPFKLARPGARYSLGEHVSVSVLGPVEPLLKGTDSDPNNNSVILKVAYGDVRFLLTGDLEEEGRERLYDASADLAAEVYKVSHHGSRNGTDRDLMERVRPKVALISCAVGNDYGHPHPEAIEALTSAGAEIYRTDLQGALTVTTDGHTWQVATERKTSTPLTISGRELAASGAAAPAGRAGEERRSAASSRPAAPRAAHDAPGSGARVIGNRRARVYHVGDTTRLPAPENRVYFASETEARRAGYRPARDR